MRTAAISEGWEEVSGFGVEAVGGEREREISVSLRGHLSVCKFLDFNE